MSPRVLNDQEVPRRGCTEVTLPRAMNCRQGPQAAVPQFGQNFAEAGRSAEQAPQMRAPSPVPHWPQKRLPARLAAAQDGQDSAGAVG